MAGDIYQHRINNTDWDDWWVFTDTRLELDNDEKYLSFLCEMIHPVVRSDTTEVAALLELFNRRLIHDGWKIIEKEKISGHPVFVAISNDADVQIQDTERIGNTYALSQLKKCDDKIGQGDYDGAISSSRSLLESVFADIFNKTTGETILKAAVSWTHIRSLRIFSTSLMISSATSQSRGFSEVWHRWWSVSTVLVMKWEIDTYAPLNRASNTMHNCV